jgi:hypothetical protein
MIRPWFSRRNLVPDQGPTTSVSSFSSSTAFFSFHRLQLTLRLYASLLFLSVRPFVASCSKHRVIDNLLLRLTSSESSPAQPCTGCSLAGDRDAPVLLSSLRTDVCQGSDMYRSECAFSIPLPCTWLEISIKCQLLKSFVLKTKCINVNAMSEPVTR